MLDDNTKFIIKIDKQEIELVKEVIAPIDVDKNGKLTKYGKKLQTREAIHFKFFGFTNNHEDTILINDIFECLAFIEIIKEYNYNKLNKDVDYDFNSFKVKAVKRKNINKLRIIFHKTNDTLYMSKVHCVILATQLTKIIHKCEVYSPNNEFILNCPSQIE